jgi:hypothetical protein
MTEAPAPQGDSGLLRYGIIAGTAFAAALAGAGITAAIDYPWHVGAAMSWRAKPAAAAAASPSIELAAAGPAAARQAAAASTPVGQPRVAPAGKARAARRAAPQGAGRHAAPAVTSAAVPPAAPARGAGVDARYDRAVAAECPQGVRGLLCREAVRWRLCRGRWSAVGAAGASRCQVGERQSAFPSVG